MVGGGGFGEGYIRYHLRLVSFCGTTLTQSNLTLKLVNSTLLQLRQAASPLAVTLEGRGVSVCGISILPHPNDTHHPFLTSFSPSDLLLSLFSVVAYSWVLKMKKTLLLCFIHGFKVCPVISCPVLSLPGLQYNHMQR